MKATRTLAVALGILATALALVASAPQIGQVSAQEETAIGVDATPERNGAAALYSIESCVSVDVGDIFEVDIVIVDVTDLLAWETYLAYDSAVVQVLDRDVEMFQAADPGSSLFNTSESVPDNGDGLFRVGAADLIDPPVGDSGSGVLARLTLEALAKGTTSLTVDAVDIDDDGQPDIGPVIVDIDGERIGDSDGDSFFDGPHLSAEVAVGSECTDVVSRPIAAGAIETADDDGDGGLRWWIIVLATAAVVALLNVIVFGYRRIRRPPLGSGGDE